jgi:hypothetical protein
MMKRRTAFFCSLIVLLVSALALEAASGSGKLGKTPADYSPILSEAPDNLYEAGMSLIPGGHFSGYGSTFMMELDGYWEFAYLRSILEGNVDMSLKARDTVFMGSAHLDLPNQLVKFAVDAGWGRSFKDGLAMQVRAIPGLYSDTDALGGGPFFMPVSCSLIRTFSPDFAGILGLQYRYGFEATLMPIIGLQWDVGDDFRFRAGLPESKVVWNIDRQWNAKLRLFWDNTSYRLDDDRDMITLEDFRLSLAVTHRYSRQLSFIGEVGYAFDRSVEFDRNPSGDISMDDTMFIRFALGGPF